MKKLLLVLLTFNWTFLTSVAQHDCESFRAYLFNMEYNVFLKIDFCNESIIVPGEELYGQLPGYLGKKTNNYCWVITSAKVKGKTAHLTMINDFGSEDLTATLTYKSDSLYIFRQEEGSTIKMAQGGKWQKIPKTLEFKRLH